MEEKKKFQSKAKENDAVKQKRAPHFYGSKEDKRKQKNASRSSNKNANNSIPKVSYVIKGLKNKGNDCWLNSLIQCINVLNINLPESENFVPDPVACALKSVLNRLNRDTKSPFYPQELHNVFRTHFGYVKGRQHDIHESYTSLLSQNTQREITENFAGVYQCTKSMCKLQQKGSSSSGDIQFTFCSVG